MPPEAMAFLLDRRSAVALADPGPDHDAIEQMVAAAVRVPDHGRLKPWRFIIIESDRRAPFGELLADHVRRERPDISEKMLDVERAKAFRAPVIIVVASTPAVSDKIPGVEQLLSAGAAAQTILLAAEALGYAGVWKTGGPAYDDAVKQALGLAPGDAIVGFLYVGTRADPAMSAATKVRPAAADHMEIWRGS